MKGKTSDVRLYIGVSLILEIYDISDMVALRYKYGDLPYCNKPPVSCMCIYGSLSPYRTVVSHLNKAIYST